MDIVRRCVESIEAEALPDGDFSPWDGAILKQETMAEWFYQEYKPYPLAKRKERLLARLHRWVEMELKKSPSAAVLKERKKKRHNAKKLMPIAGRNLSRSHYINSCLVRLR